MTNKSFGRWAAFGCIKGPSRAGKSEIPDWGYFTLYGKIKDAPQYVDGSRLHQALLKEAHPAWLETNYETVGAYLGRVNLVSLFPSAFALAALVFAVFQSLRRSVSPFNARRKEFIGFLGLAIATSLGGYFWFLIMYPNLGKGDTIKATYMLHALPFLAIVAGNLLEHIERTTRWFYRLLLSGLFLTFAHHFWAITTHFSLHRFLKF